MDSRKLHQAPRQRPFKPFGICLAEERGLPIPRPDSVAVGKRRIIVVEPDDSWSVIEPFLSAVLDYNGEHPARKNHRKGETE